MLDCIEIAPDTDARASVIWLHGLGADGIDFVPVVDELGLPADHGIRFVFPNAPTRPVTVNNGMPMRACGSRFTRKTIWSRVVRVWPGWKPSARTTRCPFTAWECRWRAPIRWTATIWHDSPP